MTQFSQSGGPITGNAVSVTKRRPNRISGIWNYEGFVQIPERRTGGMHFIRHCNRSTLVEHFCFFCPCQRTTKLLLPPQYVGRMGWLVVPSEV